jgi:hypothetical protein
MPELEEPVFNAPNFDAFEEVPEGEEASTGKEAGSTFNESYSELSGKEKTMGAEMMVEMALDLYSKGCGLLGKLPEISETKLDRMIAEGEINPKITLQTGDGAVPIKEFAVGYNESLQGAFAVSDEFKENIKPPLIRIFKKRGVGMTDEQLVAYYLVTDLGTKGVQAVMLRKTTNSILDSLRENTLALKEQNTARTSPIKQEPVIQHSVPNTPVPPASNEDYTDNISEAVVMSRPEKRKPNIPMTDLEKQVANFTEPEEEGVFANLRDAKGGFAEDYKAPAGMPDWGNPDVLATLEQIGDNPKRPVRAKRTPKTGTRKPKKQ